MEIDEAQSVADPVSGPMIEPVTETAPVTEPVVSGPRGLGGWLALVGLGLILSPFVFIGSMIQAASVLTHVALMRDILSSGTQIAQTWLRPLLVFELVGNTAFFFFTLLLLWLYFWKDYRFPKAYIAFMIGAPLFILLDTVLATPVVGGPLFDEQTLRALVRSLIALLIWGRYMQVSVRVKNTFVEGRE